MTMRIALIEPIKSSALPLKGGSAFYLRESAHKESGSSVSVREPIALETIAAVLADADHKVAIHQQNDSSDETLNREVTDFAPDIIGFSTLTYTFEHARLLASQFKRRLGTILTVFGGYHPSARPSIVLDSAIDIAVIGEGEETMLDLVEAIENNRSLQGVQGIAYERDGAVTRTPSRPRVDIARLPWAIRDEHILRHAKAAPLAYPSPPNQKSAAQISYSRGCPYACTFCPSQTVYGTSLSFRQAEDVVDEIEQLETRYGTNFLFFNDLTFTARPRKFLELCEAIARRGIKANWFAMANVGLSRELAESMAQSGCSRIGIGIESVLDEQLQEIKPSQTHDREAETLELCDSLGMLTRAYLMIGHPSETEESLARTLEKVKELPIDQIRFGFLTPFPGTPFYTQMRDRITKPFTEFTGDVPVMRLDHLPEERLLSIRKGMLIDFYNSSQYAKRIQVKTRKFPHLRESYDFLFQYLETQGIVR